MVGKGPYFRRYQLYLLKSNGFIVINIEQYNIILYETAFLITLLGNNKLFY